MTRTEINAFAEIMAKRAEEYPLSVAEQGGRDFVLNEIMLDVAKIREGMCRDNDDLVKEKCIDLANKALVIMAQTIRGNN